MTSKLVWIERLGAPTGPLLRPAMAASYLGISISGFYQQIAEDRLPPLIKIGPRAAAVPQSWLDAIIVDRLNQSAAS